MNKLWYTDTLRVHADASAVAALRWQREAVPPDAWATLTDETLWRNRSLPQLVARLSTVLSTSRPARMHLPDATRACATAAEEALLEANSGAVNVKALWAMDGHKGCRSRRKKALVDYMKALLAIGVSPHRSAVPPDQRAPAAWFQTPQASALALPAVELPAATGGGVFPPGGVLPPGGGGGVSSDGVAAVRELCAPELSPRVRELCSGAWAGSSMRQQQAVACLHRLWECDGALHAVRSPHPALLILPMLIVPVR